MKKVIAKPASRLSSQDKLVSGMNQMLTILINHFDGHLGWEQEVNQSLDDYEFRLARLEKRYLWRYFLAFGTGATFLAALSALLSN